MVLSLVKAAYAAYRARGVNTPAPGTKDWWADRACMLQDQLQTLLPAEHGDAAPGLSIVSVNPATHNMSIGLSRRTNVGCPGLDPVASHGLLSPEGVPMGIECHPHPHGQHDRRKKEKKASQGG